MSDDDGYNDDDDYAAAAMDDVSVPVSCVNKTMRVKFGMENPSVVLCRRVEDTPGAWIEKAALATPASLLSLVIVFLKQRECDDRFLASRILHYLPMALVLRYFDQQLEFHQCIESTYMFDFACAQDAKEAAASRYIWRGMVYLVATFERVVYRPVLLSRGGSSMMIYGSGGGRSSRASEWTYVRPYSRRQLSVRIQ